MNLAARIVRAWTAIYTAGLARDVRTRRRSEIASDVWEQRAHGPGDGATGVVILARCLRGMAADVSWRWTQPRSPTAPRRLGRGVGWAAAASACALLVFIPATIAVSYVASSGARTDPRWLPFTLIAGAIVATQLAGVGLAMRRRRVGLVVLGLGMWAVVAAMPWAWVVLVPVTTAGTVGVWRLSRRITWRGGTGPLRRTSRGS